MKKLDYTILELPDLHFDLSFDSAPFLQNTKSSKGSLGLVAISNRNSLVGALSFYRMRGMRKGYHSLGTFVVPTWRRMGVAKVLWRRALESLIPRLVEVQFVSHRGKTLIDSVRTSWEEVYPGMKWIELNDMDVPARNLKGQ